MIEGRAYRGMVLAIVFLLLPAIPIAFVAYVFFWLLGLLFNPFFVWIEGLWEDVI